ncbi:MAG TPA: transcription termination factor NusA [bacterium]|nr:transcription termination factor NusA [bacterium]
MSNELALVMSQLEHTKRIDKKKLVEAIQAALSSAAKKVYGAAQEVDVEFDEINYEFRAYYLKEVVEEITDPNIQLTLPEARKLDKDAEIGGVIKVRIPAEQFGRIAAQTAKQVIVQKVQDAERQSVYDQFKEKEGDLITGSVLRYEGRNVIISLGDAEALMPAKEQVPRERYSTGERMKFLVLEVRKTLKGPAIIVSRAHPNLVRKLFELEVPEIYDGAVKIESVAREAGARTKISVRSMGDDRIDAVGACVGVKGIRVQNIVDEIRGEKVDIVRWDDDPHSYLSNSLSPAKIARIIFHPEVPSAEVIVPNDQLSLAIGKKGQNARLAARLTGIKIDIKNEEQHAQEERARMDAHFQEISSEVPSELAEAKIEAPSSEAAANLTDETRKDAPPDEIDEGAVKGEVPTAPELSKDPEGLPVIPPSPGISVSGDGDASAEEN